MNNITKSIVLIVLFFSKILSYGQTQFGYTVSLNQTSIKSVDLIGVNPEIGFGFGFTALSPLNKTADFITEINYSRKNVSLKGYIDYYNNDVIYDKLKTYTIDDINVNFIFNQYIIVPNLSIQVGIGASILNDWKKKTEGNHRTFQGPEINYPYFFGISGGSEQLRATIRYNRDIGNSLRGAAVYETVDHSHLSNYRNIFGKRSFFTLTLTYYTSLFQ